MSAEKRIVEFNLKKIDELLLQDDLDSTEKLALNIERLVYEDLLRQFKTYYDEATKINEYILVAMAKHEYGRFTKHRKGYDE